MDDEILKLIKIFLLENGRVVRFDKFEVYFPNTEYRLRFVWLTPSGKLYLIDNKYHKFRSELNVFPLKKLYRLIRLSKRIDKYDTGK